MQNALLFSVIIPVYNAEDYLNTCVISIMKQTYENIEIILINDGSTDRSKHLCDEYAQQDNRVKVVHSENKGVSSARNMGLSIACGDYVLFVDSDDWIELSLIQNMAQILDHFLYDLLIYGVVKEKESDAVRLYSELKTGSYKCKEELDSVLSQLIKSEVLNSPFKVYKNSLIKENHIAFKKEISLGEDFLFNLEFTLNSSSLHICSKILYHYMVVNNESLSRKFRINKYKELMQVNDHSLILVNEKGKYFLKEPFLYIRLKNVYSCFFDLYLEACTFNRSQKINYIKYVLNNEKKKDYLHIKNLQFKTLAIFLMLNQPILIYYFIKCLKKINYLRRK